MNGRWLSIGALVTLLFGAAAVAAATRPNIVILTVDTLRADRLSGYGYERSTSPAIDRLMADGVRFDSARTPEPLTAPAMASMWTGLHPHQHGCSRNGLPIHDDLPSLARWLDLRGYETAGFIGNWTLRDRLSGLGSHFAHYEEVFTRKRWFGLVKGEATADDLNSSALEWLDDTLDRDNPRPFLLWVHYVEPHEPYRLWSEYADRLGYGDSESLDRAQRYDTEIAFVDARIGELVAAIGERVPPQETVVVFAADHGESLGEHDYWGHGRNLHEPNLRVPLSITWPEVLQPSVVAADATLLDVPRTLLGLLRLEAPDGVAGFDWSPVLRGSAPEPADRVTLYQAHRGAVQPTEVPEKARRRGLLSVARLQHGRKLILPRSRSAAAVEFDLDQDPSELAGSLPDDVPVAEKERLAEWLDEVLAGLEQADASGQVVLDEETVEQLRSLGYID